MAARAKRRTPFLAASSVKDNPLEDGKGPGMLKPKKAARRKGAPAHTIDDETYDRLFQTIKKRRSRTVTADEKRDILLLQIYLRREEGRKRAKAPGRKSKVDFSQTVADMLRRSNKTCSQVWRTAMAGEEQEASLSEGPRGQKHTRFRRSKQLKLALRNWLFERNIRRERTVAKDIVQFLIERGVLPTSCNDTSADSAATLRSVQRYIASIGWVRGTAPGSKNYREKQHIILQRDAYVLTMTEAAKTRRIVYMDESYINQPHTSHHDSLYDPSDQRDRPTFRDKARRYCFIAAIVSADPTIEAEQREPHQQARLLPETLDIFEGGNQTKDYHDMFNTAYFVDWMRKLVATLEKDKIRNTVIVMDNAKYHKTLPPDTPKFGWSKAELLEACETFGIEIDPRSTKPLIWSQLKPKIDAVVKPMAVSIAEEAGHEVLFSPPHYSDLQPIELVWAFVKGRVGRQCTLDTTFPTVKARLEAEFANLPNKTVEGCIRTACAQLDTLQKTIYALDEAGGVSDTESEGCETDDSSATDEPKGAQQEFREDDSEEESIISVV
eukprot:m.361900 g.361900  ORF g.361900 m.361900 type:complete len:553 (-) comp19975_c0_seq1:79-1737(-)